jgi:hypothetical protein
LTVWFEAAWLMAVTKNGVSAASLQTLLGLGSYEDRLGDVPQAAHRDADGLP